MRATCPLGVAAAGVPGTTADSAKLRKPFQNLYVSAAGGRSGLSSRGVVATIGAVIERQTFKIPNFSSCHAGISGAMLRETFEYLSFLRILRTPRRR